MSHTLEMTGQTKVLNDELTDVCLFSLGGEKRHTQTIILLQSVALHFVVKFDNLMKNTVTPSSS